ncbi:MAG: formate dehydrogenase accessory sulfurtransferase FdhD [Candidatus Dormiibacterota bacterium]
MGQHPGRSGQLQVEVTRLQPGAAASQLDQVAREDPLQVMVNSRPLGILMRTPGSDLELALGLLFSEGLISHVSDLDHVRIAPSGQTLVPPAGVELELDPEAENLVDVHLRHPPADGPSGWQRALPSSSACGICGSATLDAIRLTQAPVAGDLIFDPEVIFDLPRRLRAAQGLFRTTGGLHAAGLLRAGSKELEVAEDVGRHNAVDKLVGAALLRGQLPLRDACLTVSGRAGFEIIQKAAAAQVALVASISAPSSLAVQVAQATGITLIGFLRGSNGNVYSHPERLSGLAAFAGKVG